MSSSVTNPSHLLINRNPPSPAHPQLFPQSTSRHSGSSHSRQNSAPTLPSESRPSHLVEVANGSLIERYSDDDEVEEDEEEQEEEYVNVHSTFLKDSQLKGRVKVVVGRNEFWCHKEVLWFASPFFQGLLQGK